METINQNSGQNYVTLKLDSNDVPHIVYLDSNSTAHNLNYTYYNGNQWQTEIIESWGFQQRINHPSLAIDNNDHLHISYHFRNPDALKYGYNDGNQWHLEIVDALDDVGEHTFIALDQNNRPHISYYDFGNRDLKYTYHDGNQWHIERIDSIGDVGIHTSISIDSNGIPHISYSDQTNFDLKYATIDIISPILEGDHTTGIGTTGDKFQFNITASDNLNVDTVFVDWKHGALGDNLSLNESGGYWIGNVTLDHNITDLAYTIYVNDTANNYNISSLKTVSVSDNDLPEIGTRWASTISTGDPAVFSINLTDNIAIDTVMMDFTIDGLYHHNWSVQNRTGLSWEIRMVLPGETTTLEYFFWVNDTSGNWNRTALNSRPVIDNDRPMFGDMWNSDLSTGDPATVSVNATDNIGIDSLIFNITYNHVEYFSWLVTNNSGSTWHLNLTIPTDKSATTFRFEAKDTSGNINWTANWVRDIIDNDRPELVTDHTPPRGTTGDSFTFNIEAMDNIEVYRVYIDWEHGNLSDNKTLTDGNDLGNWTGTILLDHSTDDLKYSIYIRDTSFNGYKSVLKSVLVSDNDIPELNTHIIEGAPTTGDPFLVTINVSDNTHVELVYLEYTFDDRNFVNVSMNELENGTWNVSIPIIPSAVFINYSFYLEDDAGNHIRIPYDPFIKVPFNLTVIDNDGPQAVAGDNQKIDQHENVVFNANRSFDNIGIESYLWTFSYNGTDIILQGMAANFTFHIAGTYNVTLLVKDEAGLSDTDNFTVTVLDITPPVALAGQDIHIDQGGISVFNGSGSTDNVGIVEYIWTFRDEENTVVLQGVLNNHTFIHPGTYEITLNVTDSAGNFGTDTLIVVVKDITPPIAVFDMETEVVQESHVIMDGSNSTDNIGIESFFWRFYYNKQRYEFYNCTTSFIFHEPGEYYINLTVTDRTGNYGSKDVLLVVIDTQNPTALFTYHESNIGMGRTITFDGEGSSDNVAITEWKWAVSGPGGIDNYQGSSIEYTFSNVGEYEVTLTVKDARGNRDSYSRNMTVEPLDELSNGSDKGGSSIGIGAGIVLLIVIICCIIFFISRSRKKGGTVVDQETDGSDEVEKDKGDVKEDDREEEDRRNVPVEGSEDMDPTVDEDAAVPEDSIDDEEVSGELTVTAEEPGIEAPQCERCGSEALYYSEYDSWWCEGCEDYVYPGDAAGE